MGNTTGNPDQETMKCAVLEGPRKPLVIKEYPLPVPKYGELLVKVDSSAINPSDVSFTQGTYNFFDNFPTKCGFEGSGQVISSGGGFMARRLVGKKIAFISNDDKAGAWGQYHIVSADYCASLGNNENMEKAACSFVNPMTSLAFLNLVQLNGHKAVIQTAACSSLGKMNIKLFKEFGIKCINIVRREEQVEILKKLGADLILNSTDEDFENRLKEAAIALKATVCFDAVGGELTDKIVKLMPIKSTLYLYGVLSGQGLTDLSIVDLMEKGKIVSGFHLRNWLGKASLKSKAQLFYRFNKYRQTILSSEISAKYPLSEINEAISFYKKNMSLGKVIVKPNQE